MRENELLSQAEEIAQTALHNLRKFADRHDLSSRDRIILVERMRGILQNRVIELAGEIGNAEIDRVEAKPNIVRWSKTILTGTKTGRIEGKKKKKVEKKKGSK